MSKLPADALEAYATIRCRFWRPFPDDVRAQLELALARHGAHFSYLFNIESEDSRRWQHLILPDKRSHRIARARVYWDSEQREIPYAKFSVNADWEKEEDWIEWQYDPFRFSLLEGQFATECRREFDRKKSRLRRYLEANRFRTGALGTFCTELLAFGQRKGKALNWPQSAADLVSLEGEIPTDTPEHIAAIRRIFSELDALKRAGLEV